MERYTERTLCGQAIVKSKDINIFAEAMNRFAAYEDICLNADGTERISIDRLRELAEADKDGRCVVLPCKVGDTVYLVADGEVKETRLLAIKANVSDPTYSGNPSIIYEGYFQLGMHVMCWSIGNRLYLTRAEAKAAMEGGPK